MSIVAFDESPVTIRWFLDGNVKTANVPIHAMDLYARSGDPAAIFTKDASLKWISIPRNYDKFPLQADQEVFTTLPAEAAKPSKKSDKSEE